MPFTPERLGEYVAALSRLREETTKRVQMFTSGPCRVLRNGQDITDEMAATMRAEIAQLDWLIEQIAKGRDAKAP